MKGLHVNEEPQMKQLSRGSLLLLDDVDDMLETGLLPIDHHQPFLPLTQLGRLLLLPDGTQSK